MELIFMLSPLILCAGLLFKNKRLGFLWCGLVFFLFSTFYIYDYFGGAYPTLAETDFSQLEPNVAPGFLYLTKLMAMIIPDYRAATAVWAALCTLLLMLYIHKYCYYTVPSAITFAVSGLWLMSFTDLRLFMAILIDAFAFRYAAEARFIRFAAFIMLAACFRFDIILLIPLYPIFITKPTLFHIPIGAALAVLLNFVDLTPVFSFVNGYETQRYEGFLFYPVTIAVVCVLTAVFAKIIMRRSEYNRSMITLMAAAAVLGIGSIYNERLLVLGTACFFPAALTLVPEIISAAKSIAALTFREKKKPVLIALAVILAVGSGIYWLIAVYRSPVSYSSWIVGAEIVYEYEN